MSEPLTVEAEAAPLQYPASFYLRLKPGKQLPAAMVADPSDGTRTTELNDGSSHVKRFKWTAPDQAAFAQAVLDGVFAPADVLTAEQAIAEVAAKGIKVEKA